MQKRFTSAKTHWHDRTLPVGEQGIDIPAGEPVQVLTKDELPIEERWGIMDSISYYAKRMRRKCVAIKIRDWYGLIDESGLCDEYGVVGLDPLPVSNKPQTKRKLVWPGGTTSSIS